MASPFTIFRKHRTTMLVVTGVVAIVLFTAGPFLADYFQTRAMRGIGDQVAVRWNGGKLTEGDLTQLRRERGMALGFLDLVVQETLSKQGRPKAPGFIQLQDNYWEYGISRDTSDETLVRSVILAEQAKAMGIRISNDAIFEYLRQLSDNEVSRRRLGEIRRERLGDNMSTDQLLEALRTMLLAQTYESLSRTGMIAASPYRALMSESLPAAVTPAQAWEDYLRLNQNAQAELLPVAVADFKDQVGEPTAAQVQSLYEEHKNNLPNPSQPEPGFKRPYRVKYQYVEADVEDFKKEISDEEVAAYYEAHKEEYRTFELPPSTLTPDEGETPSQSEAPQNEEGDPTPSEPAPAREEAPSETPPASDQATPEPTSPESSEPSSDQQSSAPSAQRGRSTEAFSGLLREGEFFISAEDPETPEEASSAAAEQAADEPPPAEKPAEAEAPEAPAAEASTPPESTESTDAAPAAEEAAEAQPEQTPQPRYRPLEEVKDQILNKIAQQRRTEALNEAHREVDQFLKAYRLYQTSLGTRSETPAPAPLDYRALARRLNLKFHETPLISGADLADAGEQREGEPEHFRLARAYDYDMQSFQPYTFVSTAFDKNMAPLTTRRIPAATASRDAPPFMQTIRDSINPHFVYWRVEESEAHVPELAEIRDEVVEAWKMQQAVVKAREAAQKLSETARQANKPLKEALPDHQDKIVETDQFTWMTTGALPQSHAGMPRLSEVTGAEDAGEEFMKTVFALDPGGVDVAANQPQTVVYVIRLISKTPGMGVLRSGFAQEGVQGPLMQLAMIDGSVLYDKWYNHLTEQLNLTWVRPPDAT